MIQGQPMTSPNRIGERTYRQLDALSQSMIKDFYDDRKKFYKKYILNEEIEEETTQAVKMGNLVDCLLLTPEDFDNKFFMSICVVRPTEKMLAFTIALAKYTREATDSEGIVREEFAALAEKARLAADFKWDLSRVLEGFIGKDAQKYYEELRAVSGSGKMVVTANDIDHANRIVTAIRTGEFTAEVMNLHLQDHTDVYNQLAITGFVVEGRPFKGLLDFLEVNHAEKYLQPWDLKAVWALEEFYTEYYLKRKGYLQAVVYDLACTHLRNTEYEGYEVRPMKFLVCDSINYYNPLVYELIVQDLLDGFRGFTYRGKSYKGLIQLTKELNWHMDTNIWGMSMDNYLNQGRVIIANLKQSQDAMDKL